MELNFWETVSSSPTFIILFGCALVVAAFMFERWNYFRRINIDAEMFVKTMTKNLAAGDTRACLEFCGTSRAPLAAVARTGFENVALGEKSVIELMDATALEEKMKMERFLSVLGTMGNIAPFIGLFGTVVGIIRAFHDLATAGTGGPSVVAAGIAEALITTAAGLVVAIPAVISYNYFLRRVGTIMSEIESATKKLRVMMGSSEEAGTASAQNDEHLSKKIRVMMGIAEESEKLNAQNEKQISN
jgi:biopolymer transport protein ExbB